MTYFQYVGASKESVVPTDDSDDLKPIKRNDPVVQPATSSYISLLNPASLLTPTMNSQRSSRPRVADRLFANKAISLHPPSSGGV